MGELVRALEKSGIPMEGSKGEWGPGQQELNVEFCELVEQADRNVLIKHAAKEVADQKAKVDGRKGSRPMQLLP